jgi:ABC-type glycerol-3-phosphate transport system substrate-binding protein
MKRKKTFVALAVVAAAAAVLTGCSSTGSSTPTAGVKQVPNSAITVWTPAGSSVPAWAKGHPKDKVNLDVVDDAAGVFTSKISLAIKAGSGVPDVIFLANPDEISSLVSNNIKYALPLNGEVSNSVLNSFIPGTVARCTFDGKAYCLPNDIAPTVVYYNTQLFKQFGYSVPKTYSQWLALGENLAKNHPGYSLGSISDRYGLDGIIGASGCPFEQSSSPLVATINMQASTCTRVANVIGPLMQDGTLSTADPFSPSQTALVQSGKLLAAIYPAWMGLYGIKPNAKANGIWAVAPMPTWPGEKTGASGAVGGGIWVVSARSKNLKLALKFAEDMTTVTKWNTNPSGYPANKNEATTWLANVAKDPWYAKDPAPVYEAASSKISPSLGYVRYQTQIDDAYLATIIKSGGNNISSAFEQFGTEITSAAKSSGYTVSTK